MKDVDFLAGIGAITYAIVAGILLANGTVDLGVYVAQPQTAGAFGVFALGRWYRKKTKNKETTA